MTAYMPWVWLIVFLIMVGLEMATAEFVSLWFAISAIPTIIIAAIFPNNVWLQVLVFFGVGFILLLATRPIAIKYFRKNIISTNVDSYIGKTAIVIKEISDSNRGLVTFENKEWTAISSDTILVGEKVRILAIEGNKFIVTKIEN
ncbi:NfeD family protein [Acholeplasma hippikon]|uniref:NfeD-like C-terminal, partner-binding n=1 Tax=Acholeplasma hippikon TaxID=264636 RepID=A0A449BJ88_9MOLU|nr:NfeD family protein [Acholeplasma hippikon]VEU82524.1 NfeD-like C-terminal, partner-binding [Acholeplasma hippikon]